MAVRPVGQDHIDETFRVWNEVGRVNTKAAEVLGISESSVRRHVKEAERRKDRDPAVSAGMDVVGTTIVPSGMWIKTGRDEDGVSRSIFIRPQQEAPQEVLERIKAAFEGMEPAAPVSPPEHVLDDFLTCYPIADAHLGVKAWHKETGSNYDTDIAANRIRDWMAQCVAASPASGTAIIMDVGDLTHANDDTFQTPRSKHVLDVDTRMFRTLDIGIAALSGAVESALTKHREVHVVILPGNHDPSIYLAVMFALAERYRNEPRVVVHKKPGEFFLHEFGRVMIAAHHGDKAKADRMVHFVADEYAEAWGRTKHRFLFTGHLHSHKSQDIGGMKWEQLRAVTERDAYAVSNAYSARAQLQAITYHRTRGEVQRVSVNA
jgi:hypothetical protein